MRVDETTPVIVREPSGVVRVWSNDGTEWYTKGRKFFSSAQVRVTLDGHVIDDVIAADDVDGWVERYRRDSEGSLVVMWWADGIPTIERDRVFGRVAFVLPE